jgi:hypothetical protein
MGPLIWLMSFVARIRSGEQFQKATQSDYRFHFFFFATLPICFLVGEWVLNLIPQSTQSGFPFWLIITALGIVCVFLLLTVGKKDSFVYIVTSGRSILVALCVVCLEAWLKLSYVETHQNQNGSRQRWHIRQRRCPFSLTPCFSGVFKSQGGQKPFQRFCGRRKNR